MLAGQGAAARSCELLVTEGFDVNVVMLDKGEDPDTFIRRKGPAQYRERLKSSVALSEYLLDQAALDSIWATTKTGGSSWERC